MDIYEKKNSIQIAALQAWAAKDYNGTVEIYTGGGKTRVGVMAAGETLRHNPEAKALIVTPTENLRDNEWPNEIAKWGYQDVLDRIKIVCIASAYKMKGEAYDILIVDEIHASLGTKHSNLYRNNIFKYKLGLSATIEGKSTFDSLQRYKFPVVYQYTFDMAEKEGLLPSYNAYNLGIDLTASERVAYDEINARKAIIEKELLSGSKFITNAYTLAQSILRSGSGNTAAAASYMKILNQRKSLVVHASNKVEIMLKIKDMIKVPFIMFSETTTFVDGVASVLGDEAVTYHSKNKAKENRAALDLFRSGEKRILLSAKALDAGLNIPSVSVGISASGNSKVLTDTQRRGRILRPQEGKKALFISLYCKDTIELIWVNKRKAGKRVEWIENLSDINYEF